MCHTVAKSHMRTLLPHTYHSYLDRLPLHALLDHPPEAVVATRVDQATSKLSLREEVEMLAS